MLREKPKLFTIGQFAALHGINKKTLMWYDEIGLFKPAFIHEENGYRLYSYYQSTELEVILLLRDMNVPIRDIQEFMKNRSAGSMADLLRDKISELDRTIQGLKAVRSKLCSRRQEMTELLDLDLSEISLIEREPQYLATVQTSPEKSLEEEIELILEQTKKYQLPRMYQTPYGSMLPVENLLARRFEDRMLTFTVPWMDDQGMAHTNHGYRVQFNSAIGPYKGGLRFHPSVNPSIVKFLGFEQTYKNALTGLPIGGAAGGADFDPRGKSSREIMRFCQSFMTALYRLIGADTDIPAGDIGVGSREIGYLYGQYKRLTGKAESSALTGKGLTYGGSVIRQEAAGFGTVYFLARMLEHQGETLEGKRLAVSGFGNMSWGVCRKSAELGGKVVTLSGPDGYVYDPDGVCTQEKFDFMLSMRAGGADKVEPYADRFGVEFFPGKRPWEVPVDIVIPCATQNELDVEDAVMIVANNVRYYVEAANMPATAEALRLLRLSPKILTAGSKASGSGGVVVSALEMVQNSLRYSWTRQEVDSRLKQIMGGIYDASAAAAEEYGLGYDLIAGNDIAAFKKISTAMIAQGL